MSQEFEVLHLPINASERVRLLRDELAKALKSHIIVEMKTELDKLVERYPNEFDGESRKRPAFVELSFTYEGDDEGGTNTYIDYIEFTDVDGNEIDIDFEVSVKSKYSDDIWEESFKDVAREIIQDNFDCEELEEYFDGYKFDLR